MFKKLLLQKMEYLEKILFSPPILIQNINNSLLIQLTMKIWAPHTVVFWNNYKYFLA